MFNSTIQQYHTTLLCLKIFYSTLIFNVLNTALTTKMYLYGDDTATLYVDGVEQLNASWPNVTSCNIKAGSNLLAVRLRNIAGSSGLMCSLAYGSCLTDPATWKCTNVTYSNWNQITYDDRLWPLAIENYQNDGLYPHFSSNCPRITFIDKNLFGLVYCRHWLH